MPTSPPPLLGFLWFIPDQIKSWIRLKPCFSTPHPHPPPCLFSIFRLSPYASIFAVFFFFYFICLNKPSWTWFYHFQQFSSLPFTHLVSDKEENIEKKPSLNWLIPRFSLSVPLSQSPKLPGVTVFRVWQDSYITSAATMILYIPVRVNSSAFPLMPVDFFTTIVSSQAAHFSALVSDCQSVCLSVCLFALIYHGPSH